jgi:hypothetical protein
VCGAWCRPTDCLGHRHGPLRYHAGLVCDSVVLN